MCLWLSLFIAGVDPELDGTCFFVLLDDFCFILFPPISQWKVCTQESKHCPDGDVGTCVLALPHGPSAAHAAVPSSLGGSVPTCSPSPLVLCSFTVLKLSESRFSGSEVSEISASKCV